MGSKAEFQYTLLPEKPSDQIVFENSENKLFINGSNSIGDVIGTMRVRSILSPEYYITDFKNSTALTIPWIEIEKKRGVLRLVRKPDDLEAIVEITALAGQFTRTVKVKFSLVMKYNNSQIFF